MPRIKLKERPFYTFCYKTLLKIRDINYGKHLSNDAVVSLLHEARIYMLQHLGFSEQDLGDGKTGTMMADLAVNYIKEGFLGDKIKIHLNIEEISKKSFRIFYKIERGRDLIVLAETGIVMVDYQAKSTATIPEMFLTTLKQYQHHQN
jgi:acyl-CoA thioester hydrolase